MERILVGVDGSPASRHALAWAAQLCRRAGLTLLAARVFVPPRSESTPALDVDAHDRQRHELDEWCQSFGDLRLGGAVLLDGAPPDALLGAAREHKADLLVVGGRGAGGFLHLHLGSVAHHLTHHTTLPLAIVPGSAAVHVTRFVVGVDGSRGSLAAVDLIAELAARLGVGVTAVYAFEPFVEWVPDTDPRSWHHQAQVELREWSAAVVEAGVELEIDVDRDIHPVAAIARALAAHPGAAVAVGTRGLGGFRGLRLGRVPLQLVHHAGTAVIVVPAAPAT